MTAWISGQLAAIGAADDLTIAPERADGTLRPEVTIWGSCGPTTTLHPRRQRSRRRLVTTSLRDTPQTNPSPRRRNRRLVEDTSDSAELTASIQAEYHRTYDRPGERVTRGALSLAAHHTSWHLQRGPTHISVRPAQVVVLLRRAAAYAARSAPARRR